MPATYAFSASLHSAGTMVIAGARDVTGSLEGTFAPRQVATTVFNHSPPPVLIGGLIALFLSGAVFMQVALYFQLYQTDRMRIKTLVLVIWTLDLIHSSMVITANWENLVAHYGAFDKLDSIAWSIAITIALTAVTTFVVHCFFIQRIYSLSRGNLYITAPLIMLALLRVGAASVTTAQMIKLGNYPLFVSKFSWVFTLGLAVSSSLDVLITIIMCYYIRRGRTAFVRMNRIIDVLTLYTVENGMITCVATSLSMFFWLFMRSNFAFIGMHLAINKLYANSFLASLNARKTLANKSQGSGNVVEAYALPVRFPSSHTSRDNQRHGGLSVPGNPKAVEITIDVEQTVQRDLEGDRPTTDGDSESVELEKRITSDVTDAKHDALH
ncbi:hypothetical protein C8Q77DRAFT_1151874 [Trametes polyzona]|nr:hypothetical protein C8Q77DRAFT_1151874 [Trametes polyzona]